MSPDTLRDVARESCRRLGGLGTPEDLVGWLTRETSFPYGAILLTGTGIVPPDAFTLARGDDIRITIDGIGTLANRVA